jgi:hypothetical protein
MKRMISVTVLVLLVSAVSLAKNPVVTGKTFSPLGDYKIVATDNPVSMKGKECKTFRISYENTPLEVTLVVLKDGPCKRYVVLSEKLSVQYVCYNEYFGVEKLNKDFSKEGLITSDADLNRLEYFHQKVLGPGQIGENEATRLVAAYFPFLLNNTDQVVAAM